MATTVADIGVKWSGEEYKISGLTEDQSVLDLKKAIQKKTGVLPERQKLLGLKYKGVTDCQHFTSVSIYNQCLHTFGFRQVSVSH